MADINQEFSAAMAAAQAELAEFGVISDATANRLKVAGAAVEQFEKKMQLATAATSALYKSFTSYNKAVTEGVKGYKDLAETTDSLATSIEALSAALAFVLPIGRVAKIAIAGLGLLAGELVRSSKQIGAQLDNLRSGFDTLAQVGATTSQGLTGMFNLMQQLSMSATDFAAFSKEIAENSELLAKFGGNVTVGVEEFGNLANNLKPMRNELMNFGIRIEQIGEASLGFVKNQRMFTLGNKANMDLSTKSMMGYVKELDTITRLTGISRKEQEKAMDEAMRHDAFVATLDDMVAQGKEKEAKMILENVAFYKQKGPQALKAYLDSVSGFIGSTEESAQGFLAAGGAIQDQIDDIKAGRVKNVADLAESNKQVNKAMADVAETIGRGAAQLGVQFGLPYHEMRNAIQGATVDVTKALGQIATDQNKTDGILKKQNEMLIKTNDEMLNNQKTLQAFASAYQSGINTATGALGTFTGALNRAAQAAANFFGGRSVGAGVGETSPSGADDSAAIMAAAGGGGGAPPPAATAPSVSSQADLEKLGLRIKQGDVQRTGAELSPRLIELAKQIQETIPGFNYFSGFNDNFHADNKSSRHSSGLAADFTVSTHPTIEEGKAIIATLKSLGASLVLDEYNFPSSGASGKHFHVEVPKFEAGGNLRGIGLVGEKGPELAVGSASITSNTDIMGAFRDMISLLEQNQMALRDIANNSKSTSDISDQMLRIAQN